MINIPAIRGPSLNVGINGYELEVGAGSEYTSIDPVNARIMATVLREYAKVVDEKEAEATRAAERACEE